jgi:hypothetical protein
MTRLIRVITTVCIATSISGCNLLTGVVGGDDGGGDSRGKPISTAAQAQAAFALLRASGDAVDRQLATTFNGSTSVTGASGQATVSGKKSATSTSSSSSTSTSRSTDLQISFAGFRMTGGTGSITGGMRWFDYYYSRTACSSTTCASSSDRSEAVEGTGIRVEFTSGGETISDEITIDADSPSYTSRWTVKITTRSGQVFSFSA